MEIQSIINELAKPRTQESELLRRRLTRALYKLLGAPSRDDFPEPYTKNNHYSRTAPYTGIAVAPRHYDVQLPVDYHIDRPSPTKQAIINDYYRDGWDITVHAYNVACSRCIAHPRYESLVVRFVSTRDKATYEYLIAPAD